MDLTILSLFVIYIKCRLSKHTNCKAFLQYTKHSNVLKLNWIKNFYFSDSYTQRFPSPGETVSGKEFRKGTGGKTSNACVMAVKLGLSAGLLAKVVIN